MRVLFFPAAVLLTRHTATSSPSGHSAVTAVGRRLLAESRSDRDALDADVGSDDLVRLRGGNQYELQHLKTDNSDLL